MAAQFADLPEAIENTIEIARRCAFRPKKRNPILPEFVPESGRTPEEEVRAQAEEGLTRAAGTARPLGGGRRSITKRLDYELGIINRMGFPGYFLIVSDFMKWTRGAGHSGRRARLGRLLAGGLGAGHHQSRSHPLRPVLRALPQSRTHLDAGLRHRFLPGAARRGGALCARQIWRRPRGADHRAGFAAGARRGARCRPRAADAAGPGRPHRQADPQSAGQSRSRCATRSTASRGCSRSPNRSPSPSACSRSPRRSKGFIATPPPIPPAW